MARKLQTLTAPFRKHATLVNADPVPQHVVVAQRIVDGWQNPLSSSFKSENFLTWTRTSDVWAISRYHWGNHTPCPRGNTTHMCSLWWKCYIFICWILLVITSVFFWNRTDSSFNWSGAIWDSYVPSISYVKQCISFHILFCEHVWFQLSTMLKLMLKCTLFWLKVVVSFQLVCCSCFLHVASCRMCCLLSSVARALNNRN